MSVAQVYCRDLSRQLRFLATWPPGAPISVGRIGRFFGDNVFDPETSLGSFGIAFTVEDDPEGSRTFSFASDGVNESGVAARVKVPDLLSGALTAAAKATISFEREHSIVFRATGLRYRVMQDQPQMARSVASLIDQGQWGRDWYIVTQVVEAESASILISSASSAEVELALSADVTGIGIELLGAEFKPRVVRQKGMSTLMLNEEGLVPLFRAKRVKRTVFNNVKLEAGFGSADVSSLTDLDDERLLQELLEEVDVVDALVLGESSERPD